MGGRLLWAPKARLAQPHHRVPDRSLSLQTHRFSGIGDGKSGSPEVLALVPLQSKGDCDVCSAQQKIPRSMMDSCPACGERELWVELSPLPHHCKDTLNS